MVLAGAAKIKIGFGGKPYGIDVGITIAAHSF